MGILLAPDQLVELGFGSEPNELFLQWQWHINNQTHWSGASISKKEHKCPKIWACYPRSQKSRWEELSFCSVSFLAETSPDVASFRSMCDVCVEWLSTLHSPRHRRMWQLFFFWQKDILCINSTSFISRQKQISRGENNSSNPRGEFSKSFLLLCHQFTNVDLKHSSAELWKDNPVLFFTTDTRIWNLFVFYPTENWLKHRLIFYPDFSVAQWRFWHRCTLFMRPSTPGSGSFGNAWESSLFCDDGCQEISQCYRCTVKDGQIFEGTCSHLVCSESTKHSSKVCLRVPVVQNLSQACEESLGVEWCQWW